MKRLSVGLAVLALALALPGLVRAAEVTGRVVDDTGAVLPGATVTLTGPAGTRTATTGPNGRYALQNLPAGTYSLSVTLSGFVKGARDNVMVQDPSTEVAEVALAIAGFGETMTVTGRGIESTITNAPVTMSVIPAEVIENAPSQNLGDLLRTVPGVNVIQMSARDINLTARQSTSTLATSQLTLLDGRSIYLDFFGLVLWDLVPSNPNEIKQIEVVRGPASAVWGANALTGVVNIITKSPREAQGITLSLTGGIFGREGGSREADGTGQAWGGSLSINQAPNDHFSWRLSGGYYDSDPYSRPTGIVPISHHPLDPSIITGGAPYPTDCSRANDPTCPPGGFENQGTKQPKVDGRADWDFESSGGTLTIQGGYAGTEGIVHTGIGPFDLQNGSYMGYGRIGYTQGALKVASFVNFLDADAPNLLLTDPATLRPVALNFKTQTYDFDVSHFSVVDGLGGQHILSYGGNARRNNFEITLTPDVEDRNEFGLYLQDEFHAGGFRLTAGVRADKFGNLDDWVLSPRVTVMYKPAEAHALRVSFNRAFRSPSAVNNYLDQNIFAPTLVDLRALAPLAPPPLQQMISSPFNLVVRNVGNRVGSTSGTTTLKQESLNAWEVSYTGTFNDKTTVGVALYQNDSNDNINFTQVLPSPEFPQGIVPPFDVYSPDTAPPVIGINQQGIPVSGPLLIGFLAQVNQILPPQARIFLPRTVSTYLNLGPLRQRGFELSLDHRFSPRFTATANYSFQDTPEPLEPDPGQLPYPNQEVGIPSRHRFNVGFNFDSDRFLGNAMLTYTDKAFWVDVLSAPYYGQTDAFTLLNATFGVKFADGKAVLLFKGTNLLNQTVQQHIFGDILRASGFAELRLSF